MINGTSLVSGIILGLSGGLTPGPLLTLVIAETVKHGFKEGAKVSMAPLLTDLPIVAAAVVLLHFLADIRPLLGVMAFGGSAFLAYLAWEGIRFKGVGVAQAPRRPRGLRKGVIANFLNPSPYLFWFSIGAPMVLRAADTGYGSAALFIGGFYLFLVGSKLAVAALVGQSRRFLQSFVYIMVVRLLGVVLVLFAGLFFKDGLSYWGILG